MAARCFGFLHFLFGAGEGDGAGLPPPPPDDWHGVSVGVTEFALGFGVVTEKSLALLFVSSPASSMVGQPAWIDRRRAMPEVRAGAGVPGSATGP